MFLTNLLNINKSCNHDKITPDMECGYCPDCGRFVENKWYIARCKCCGLKLKTACIKGEIRPQNHYCSNCGGEEYFIEQLDKIDFINISFAILKKQVVEQKETIPNTIQCWQEKTPLKPKLLTQFLQYQR